MKGLTRVVLRLGRNPGHPEGDDHYGYVVMAPLDADYKLDPGLWTLHRMDCTVRRFHPNESPADGWLRRRGDQWFFWYDEEDEGPEEQGVRLGDHRFFPGEYVTIREGDGDVMTFRVAEAVRV